MKIMNILDPYFRSSNCHLVINITKLFLKYNKGNDIFNEVLKRVKDSLITFLIAVHDEMKYNILYHIHELIKLGGAEYFRNDYKRFFCEG